MKFLTLATLISFSLSSLADVPAFWPKQSTCQEIKEAMNQYGSVGINVKYLFGMETFTVYPKAADCDAFHYERTMKVRTSDGIKCVVGKYCEPEINP